MYYILLIRYKVILLVSKEKLSIYWKASYLLNTSAFFASILSPLLSLFTPLHFMVFIWYWVSVLFGVILLKHLNSSLSHRLYFKFPRENIHVDFSVIEWEECSKYSARLKKIPNLIYSLLIFSSQSNLLRRFFPRVMKFSISEMPHQRVSHPNQHMPLLWEVGQAHWSLGNHQISLP